MSNARRSSSIARREFRRRPSYIASMGLVGALVLLLLLVFSLRSPFGIPGRGYHALTVQVADPGNLQAHDPVRIAGIRVGQVIGVDDGAGAVQGQSLVRLKIDPGTEQLPRSTKARVRAAGLLGARYVELVPGAASSAGKLAWGTVVKTDRNAVTYGVTDLLDTFDKQTRTGLDSMINEYGRGLVARGQGLNDAIRTIPEGEADFRGLAAEILSRPGSARRFLPATERSAAAFSSAREDFVDMLRPTAQGLRPFVDEREAIRSTLDKAPNSLASLQSGMQRGQQLLRSARDLSDAARDVLPAAPVGLRATSDLLRTSDVPLERATRLMSDLRPTVPSVLKITKALSPNLQMLTDAFKDGEQLASAISPYNCDIESGAHSFRSLIGYPVGPSVDGGTTGEGWTGFRAVVIAGGPELTGTLTPTIGGNKGISAEPYPPACKYSPGGRYELGHLVTPYPKAGAR